MEENSNLVDPRIYKKANQRAHFKFHLAIYVLSMLVLWIIYIFLFKATEPKTAGEVINGGMTFLKFVVLLTALWTVIIVFHGLFIYKFNSSMLEKEIKALQKEIKEKEELKRALMTMKKDSDNNSQK